MKTMSADGKLGWVRIGLEASPFGNGQQCGLMDVSLCGVGWRGERRGDVEQDKHACNIAEPHARATTTLGRAANCFHTPLALKVLEAGLRRIQKISRDRILPIEPIIVFSRFVGLGLSWVRVGSALNSG